MTPEKFAELLSAARCALIALDAVIASHPKVIAKNTAVGTVGGIRKELSWLVPSPGADAEGAAAKEWLLGAREALRAFEIADKAMLSQLQSECYKDNGRLIFPPASALGHDAALAAFEWLQTRGYVGLVSDGEGGEFIRLVKDA